MIGYLRSGSTLTYNAGSRNSTARSGIEGTIKPAASFLPLRGSTRIHRTVRVPIVLGPVSLDFEDAQLASSVERTVTRLEQRIKATHPNVTRVFIEAQSFEASRRNKINTAPHETTDGTKVM